MSEVLQNTKIQQICLIPEPLNFAFYHEQNYFYVKRKAKMRKWRGKEKEKEEKNRKEEKSRKEKKQSKRK